MLASHFGTLRRSISIYKWVDPNMHYFLFCRSEPPYQWKYHIAWGVVSFCSHLEVASRFLKMISALFVALIVCGTSAENWNNFFELKCLKVQTPQLALSCPVFQFDRHRCVPWNTALCSVSVARNKRCFKVDCSVSNVKHLINKYQQVLMDAYFNWVTLL